MPRSTLPESAPPPASADHLIVARDHAELVYRLREIAQGKFTVVVNRRNADRRQRYQSVRVERRRAQRRTGGTTHGNR